MQVLVAEIGLNCCLCFKCLGPILLYPLLLIISKPILNAVAMLDLEAQDTLLEIPVSSILNPVLCMILFTVSNYV